MSCSCGKKSGSCSCIPAGPIGPQGPAGQTGQRGNDGLGIRQSYVSDGITPIGNIIYPANTLVFQMTDLSYQSAGLIYSLAPLVWVDLVMENGWTTTASGTVDRAQYAISNGMLYLRGVINGVAATQDLFTTIATLGNSDTIATVVSEYNTPATQKLMSVYAGGSILIGSRSAAPYALDSVPPISIR